MTEESARLVIKRRKAETFGEMVNKGGWYHSELVYFFNLPLQSLGLPGKRHFTTWN